MKKKHFSLVLRILFAAAGVAYIAFNLTWSDNVAAPRGTHEVLAAPDYRRHTTVTLDKPQNWKVVEGDLLGDDANLTIESKEGHRRIIPRAQLGAGVDDFCAKPGVTATLTHARLDLLLLGLLIVGPIYIIQSYRWWLLMKTRGIDVTIWKAFRLTMVGSFFNYCMPGTIGGDLVKAWYAAKNSDRRADCVMTVIFDRITGLVGLIVLGGVAGLCMVIATKAGWQDLHEKQEKVVVQITGLIWLGMLAAGAGACIYFSQRIRRALGITWERVQKLPGHRMMVKIDDAALAYKKHIGVVLATVAMSLPVHLALAGATALAGYALGMETPLGLLLTVVPVLFLAAAVPFTYQGLGVMEGLAMVLILGAGATENHIVGMLLMIRFYQIFYSLLGSLFLLRGDIHMHPQIQTDDGTPAAPAAPAAPAGQPAAHAIAAS